MSLQSTFTSPQGPQMSSGQYFFGCFSLLPFSPFSSADMWELNFGEHWDFFGNRRIRESLEWHLRNIPHCSYSWSPATVRSPIRAAKYPLACFSFFIFFFHIVAMPQRQPQNASLNSKALQLKGKRGSAVRGSCRRVRGCGDGLGKPQTKGRWTA